MTETRNVLDIAGAPLEKRSVSAEEEERPLGLEAAVARYIELRSRLERTENCILEGPNGELKNAEPEADPDTRIVNIIAEQVYSELGDEANSTAQDVYLGVRTRLEAADPAVFALVAPYLDGAIEIDAEMRTLDERYGQAATAERDAAVERLGSQVDWDNVVDLLATYRLNWPEDATMQRGDAFIAISALCLARGENSLYWLRDQTRELNDLFRFADSIGALRAEPVSRPDEGWFAERHVAEAVSRWQRLTEEAIEYMDRSRRTRAHSLLVQMAVSSLEQLGRSFGLGPRAHEDGDGGTTFTPVAVAYERLAKRTFDEYDRREAELNLADAHARPDGIYIGWKHRDELTRTTGIRDVPGWIAARLARFGDRLGGGIGFIEFTDTDRIHDYRHGASMVVDAGERRGDENKLYIDIREGTHRRFDRIADPQDRANGIPARIARGFVADTMDHEVGHHIHGAQLTVAELRRCHEVLERQSGLDSDDKYIQRLIAEGTPQRRVRVERFAIAVQRYMRDPLPLALDYPECFAAFNDLIDRYNPTIVAGFLASVHALRHRGEYAEADRQLEFRQRQWTNIMGEN